MISSQAQKALGSFAVLLASMAIGANVYLMAAQFQTLKGTVASSLVLSTAAAAITTPLLLAAMKFVVP